MQPASDKIRQRDTEANHDGQRILLVSVLTKDLLMFNVLGNHDFRTAIAFCRGSDAGSAKGDFSAFPKSLQPNP
jgi:hypothetical protein